MSTATKFLATDETVQGLLAEMKSQTGYLAALASTDIQKLLTSPTPLQSLVRSGNASKVLSIGDQVVTTWTDPDTGTAYEYPFDIVDFAYAELATGNSVPALWLQAHYSTPLGYQFSQYQAFYYAETAVLAAGTYNVTMGYNWGTNVVKDKVYQFTLTQPVPIKGQLSGFNSAPDKAPSTWTVSSWASNTATTAIETVAVTEGSAGTSLGTFTEAGDTALNSLQKAAYGNNRYTESQPNQILNATGTAWWTAQSKYDRVPDQYNKHGYLEGFADEFLSVIGKPKVQIAANTVSDGGGTDVIYPRFFLPSLEQMYVTPQASGVEGSYWPYWKQVLARTTPAAYGTVYDAYKTYAINAKTSAQYTWFRSAYRGSACNPWYVTPAGGVGGSGAVNAFRLAPACCIM